MKRHGRRRFLVRRRDELLHELYLEIGGAFARFDVDKGPSPSPIEGRGAIDRGRAEVRDPFEESDETGLVWDVGAIEPLVDPEEGLQRGKLLFRAFGHKMKGTFALGRARGRPQGRGRPWLPSDEWVLLKKPDAFSDRRGHYSPRSVLSGRRLGEERGVGERIGPLVSGVPMGRFSGFMEVARRSAPFVSSEFLFELDPKGARVLASRSGLAGLPSGPLPAAPAHPTSLAFGSLRAPPETRPKPFPEIQAALAAHPLALEIDGQVVVLDRDGRPDPIALERRRDGASTDLDHPAILFAFDLLSVDGRWLGGLGLEKRKAILEIAVEGIGPILMATHVAERGDSVAEALASRAPDVSILARRRASKYIAGPSEDWIGCDPPREPPARIAAGGSKGDTGLEGLPLKLTNLDKVFWPEKGYTKGDLLRYYRAVAPHLLPHLVDRPIVLTRHPDGIHGKSFFQHNAPGAKSAWLRTARIQMSKRPRDYFLADDLESLLYLVNLGTIPLHVWPSRVESIERPDWCAIDLDRGERGFVEVVEVALRVRELCESIELPSFPKTSGGGGMHVLIPLGGQLSFDQSRALGELVARSIVARHPTLATVELSIAGRGGRVLIDHLVNARGRMLVSPYAVRPLPRATVSTPLAWSEVGGGLDPGAFTIETVPGRLAAIGDPWASLLETAADVPRALALLSERL
jgi:bifunctional non-homologous end joining protein LigD